MSDGAGRRARRSNTRTRILRAALELFAAKGYSGTTLRAIAGRADVDPAMIRYFFDGKDVLFRDAVSSRIDLSTLFDGPTAEEAQAAPMSRGERLARTFLPVWEDESTRPALVAVYRTGMSDGPIARTLRDRVQAALASCLGRIAPEETERSPMFTSSVSAQLTGLVMLRYVFPAEPLASLDVEELTKLFGLAVERGTSCSCQ